MPEISVLLPCRNAAPTLAAALRSLTAQTFEDIEIVAVDDGSDDETGEVLARWADRDARIRVTRTGRRGIVSALRVAVDAARGTLLARMDADDRSEPTRLGRQRQYLYTYPHIAACATGVRYFPRRLVRSGARRYEAWVNAVTTPEAIERELFVECPLPHPTLMIRRRTLVEVGGYTDAPWPEDYDLVLRLWAAGHRLGKVAAVLHHWRESPTRLSRTHARYRASAFRRCKVHYLPARLGSRPVVVWGAGRIGKAFARALTARHVEVRAFIDIDPRKIGQRVGPIPVTGPEALAPLAASAYVVAAVGTTGARERILAALETAGLRIPEDACAVA